MSSDAYSCLATPDDGYDVSKLPKSIDLSHHLSDLSKSRQQSPLKKLIEYMKQPGMISLAGGLPHPSLFPFHSVSVDAYGAPFGNESVTNPGKAESHQVATVQKTTQDGENLDVALQYQVAKPNTYLAEFLKNMTTTVFQPGYQDFQILFHHGNTDAWAKTVQLICDPGDYILVEEHTFPSAQSMWIPMHIKGVPVKMDQYGILPSHLKSVLDNWNSTYPGANKPKLLYTVPIGQNPTGTVMIGQRKKELYEVCVEHDIVICEDDPYFFLQMGTFDHTKPSKVEDPLPALEPSFLKYDYQGRVIRLDSFSKVIAPGNRLGWFVCNPIFSERLQRAIEVTSQSPCGWSVAILTELFRTWEEKGWAQWLDTMRRHYRMRRDWICQAIADSFDLVPATEAFPDGSVEGLVAYFKSSKGSANRKPVFSFVAPEGGMFLWLDMHIAGSRTYQDLVESYKSQGQAIPEDIDNKVIEKIWMYLADNKVLMSPGMYFNPWEGFEGEQIKVKAPVATTNGSASHSRPHGHLRMAFSTLPQDGMVSGVVRMEEALAKIWTA